MIPKRIITYWINDKGLEALSPLHRKCGETHKIPGYDYKIITIEDCKGISPYVDGCLKNNRFVKASDYMRMWYLLKYGGILLDFDMEVLPNQNFDDLLDCRMFTSFECCGLTANAGMGAEPGHELIKEYLRVLDDNFRGEGELVFEPGIKAFHDVFWKLKALPGQDVGNKHGIRWTDTRMFFPFNHVTGKTDIQPWTKVMHHYAKSWM